MPGLFAALGVLDFPFGLEARNLGGINGGLTLGIVEVGRDGHHRLVDGVSQVGLGRLFQFPQHHGGNFRRRVLFAIDFHLHQLIGSPNDPVRDELFLRLDFVMAPAHEALDRVDSAARVHHGLALGRVAHEAFALVGESHHTGRQAIAVLVWDDRDLASIHNGHD